MIFIIIILGLFFLGILAGIWKLIEWLKPTSKICEKVLGIITFISLAIFIVVLGFHSTPYNKNIDPFVENCYSPISYENSGLLIIMHLLALFSMLVLYFREFRLPPLQLSIYIILLTIGIILNFTFLHQVSYHDTSRIHLWDQGDNAGFYLALYPIFFTISSVAIITKLIVKKAKLNSQLKYKNKYLNSINQTLITANNLPFISILLTIPILLIIMIILVVFGQDIDSFTKVYSETATWKLSQHIHPPTVDDRHGHYLCTVAAYGSHKIVKPIGLGRRNNKVIIINRQLQIANAFEYMVEKISPNAHRLIRTNYDKHGINLARRINNIRLSNLTYTLMKPIEWIFLIFLYAYFIDPEKIIKNQYKYAT